MMQPKLHVPAVPARPGEAPNFSYVQLAPPGAVPRPDPRVPVRQTVELAESLIRVLDEQGEARGPWNPALTPNTLLSGLRDLVLTRVFDERMQRTQRQGRITFYVRSYGEEAVSVAAAAALADTDMLFPLVSQSRLVHHAWCEFGGADVPAALEHP